MNTQHSESDPLWIAPDGQRLELHEVPNTDFFRGVAFLDERHWNVSPALRAEEARRLQTEEDPYDELD